VAECAGAPAVFHPLSVSVGVLEECFSSQFQCFEDVACRLSRRLSRIVDVNAVGFTASIAIDDVSI